MEPGSGCAVRRVALLAGVRSEPGKGGDGAGDYGSRGVRRLLGIAQATEAVVVDGRGVAIVEGREGARVVLGEADAMEVAGRPGVIHIRS